MTTESRQKSEKYVLVANKPIDTLSAGFFLPEKAGQCYYPMAVTSPVRTNSSLYKPQFKMHKDEMKNGNSKNIFLCELGALFLHT